MSTKKLVTREFIRYPVALAAEVAVQGRVRVASTKDISKGGLSLVTREALPEGEAVSVTLFLTQDGIEDPDTEPLEVKGSVVWAAEQEEGTHIAGLRFAALTKPQASRLDDLIAELVPAAAQNQVA